MQGKEDNEDVDVDDDHDEDDVDGLGPWYSSSSSSAVATAAAADTTTTQQKYYQKQAAKLRNYRLNSLSPRMRSTRKSYFVDILLLLGFHVYYAKGEAERACTALCKSGIVDAVLVQRQRPHRS